MWPVVLGMGPHNGLTTALLRVGERNSRELVYRVLEVARRWVYDAFGDPPTATARPHISVHWEGGINTALLVGQDDSPPTASMTVDPIHVWRAVGAVCTGQQIQRGLPDRQGCSARVPRVWVSWWAGDTREVLTVAIQPLCGGTRVHWIVFTEHKGDLRGERGVRVVGVELGRYKAVLLTTDDHGIHGVPPQHFASIMQDV